METAPSSPRAPERAARQIEAVLFDYGGVLRRDECPSAYDVIDTKFSLAPGALWWAFHDIPEYRLSREGAIDRAAYREAVRCALLEREGTDGRVDAALAAFDAHIAALPPLDVEMQGLLDDLRAAGRVRLGLLSNAPRGFTERLRAALRTLGNPSGYCPRRADHRAATDAWNSSSPPR